MTVTDDNTATENSSPNAITPPPPHAPNYATAPDAEFFNVENKMSARQLLDGQEYPVAKGDIIKNCFDL